MRIGKILAPFSTWRNGVSWDGVSTYGVHSIVCKPPISSCKLLLYQPQNEYVKFSYIPLCSLCVGYGGQGHVLINLVEVPFLVVWQGALSNNPHYDLCPNVLMHLLSPPQLKERVAKTSRLAMQSIISFRGQVLCSKNKIKIQFGLLN